MPEPLDILFSGIASVKSGPREVVEGVIVEFGTLTNEEVIEIGEEIVRFKSLEARAIVAKVHTLARAILTLNNQPLQLSESERKALKNKLHLIGQLEREPNRVEQAVEILLNKVPRKLVDLIDDEYLLFEGEIASQIENLKKKSSPTGSGEQNLS